MSRDQETVTTLPLLTETRGPLDPNKFLLIFDSEMSYQPSYELPQLGLLL